MQRPHTTDIPAYTASTAAFARAFEPMLGLGGRRTLRVLSAAALVVLVGLSQTPLAPLATAVASSDIASCDTTGLQAALNAGGTWTVDCTSPITLTGTLSMSGLGGAVTLDGTGYSPVIEADSNGDRLLNVTGGSLTLTGLTLCGAPSGNCGTGNWTVAEANTPSEGGLVEIAAGATVVITNSTLEQGTAAGAAGTATADGGAGQGGAVYNAGTLTVTSSSFDSNVAVGGAGANGANGANGAAGTSSSPDGSPGVPGGNGTNGGAGQGGAIYNAGTLTVTNSTSRNDRAVGGNGGSGGSGGNGGNGADFLYVACAPAGTACTGLNGGNGGVGGAGGRGGDGGAAQGGDVFNVGALTLDGGSFGPYGLVGGFAGAGAGGGNGGSGGNAGNGQNTGNPDGATGPPGGNGGNGGNGGINADGGNGGPVEGGSIYNSGSMTVSDGAQFSVYSVSGGWGNDALTFGSGGNAGGGGDGANGDTGADCGGAGGNSGNQGANGNGGNGTTGGTAGSGGTALGGDIYTAGSATIVGATFSTTSFVSGGGGYGGGHLGGGGGNGGGGGGGYNYSGTGGAGGGGGDPDSSCPNAPVGPGGNGGNATNGGTGGNAGNAGNGGNGGDALGWAVYATGPAAIGSPTLGRLFSESAGQGGAPGGVGAQAGGGGSYNNGGAGGTGNPNGSPGKSSVNGQPGANSSAGQRGRDGLAANSPFYGTVELSSDASGVSSAGTATAANEGVTATATGGTGTVFVGTYSGDPVGPGFPTGAVYFNVGFSAQNTFTGLTISFCNLPSGDSTIYWWNGSAFQAAPNQTANSPNTGCITVAIDNTTTPNISQMTNALFAAGQGTPVTWNGSISVGQGWNAVSLPLDPDGTLTASGLLSRLLTSTGGKQAALAAYANGRYQLAVMSGGLTYTSDFPLQAGAGYFLLSDRAGSFTDTGGQMGAPPTLSLAPGWNLIGVPLAISSESAQTLLERLTSAGFNPTEVATYSGGTWTTYVQTAPGSYTGTNFVLSPQQSYFVLLQGGGNWSEQLT